MDNLAATLKRKRDQEAKLTAQKTAATVRTVYAEMDSMAAYGFDADKPDLV